MIKTLVKINPVGIRSRNWKILDLALMALRKIAFVKKVKVEVVIGIDMFPPPISWTLPAGASIFAFMPLA